MSYDAIAAWYDLFDADDPGALWHRAFVLARAAGCEAALDVGAGTGRVAFALAERGLLVWAVEPSRGMRDVMRARLGDDTSLDAHLTLVPGDARTVAPRRRFPLIVFSHASYLLDADGALAALRNLAGLLAPAGALITDFALEEGRTERPRALAAERRIGEVTVRRFSASRRVGPRSWAVTWEFEAECAGQRVDGASASFVVNTVTLDEGRARLAAAGLKAAEEYGDYAGSRLGVPDRASRYVVVARRD